ncbi:hypothetical protein HC256_009374 [Beauveria bassiana]|nr:hypothetical protein HC256_009374 [Beauveria bassiana]
MNKNPQFSKLESLNSDVHLAILGSCDSFKDLATLIQASPTLFRAFLKRKTPLLLSVVENILGPATRDAVLLEKTSIDKSNNFHHQVDKVVHDYKAHLRVARPPWVTGLDAETVVALTHITRRTQFCVDVFGHIHRQQLISKQNPAESNANLSERPRLSRNERIRISQAILRRQVLNKIYTSGIGKPVNWYRFMSALLPLFRTWEWQQISDMDYFMSFLWDWLQFNTDACLHNLDASGLEVIAKVLMSHLESKNVSLDYLAAFWFTHIRNSFQFGDLHFLAGSHHSTASLLNDSQHSNILGDYDDSGLEPDTDDQPWAWRDALCGNKTCRWGIDLVPSQRGHYAHRKQFSRLRTALVNWREFGMVFWDRDRVERMKETRQLKLCQTGWLVPWQN